MPLANPPARWSHKNGEAMRGAVDRTKVPEKIKCSRCDKVKTAANFSNRQIENVKTALFKSGNQANAAKTGYAFCNMCSGTQVSELTCYLCTKRMSLDMFSKAQRKNPDNAKCLECNEQYLNNELGTKRLTIIDSDHDGDEEDGYESESSGASNPYEDQSIASTDGRSGVDLPLSSLSLSGTSKENWYMQARAGFESSSTTTARTTTLSNSVARAPIFDSTAYRSTSTRAASVAGSAFSGKTNTPARVTKGGWARPPKAPEPKVELVAADQSDDEDFRGKKRVDSSDEADSDFVL